MSVALWQFSVIAFWTNFIMEIFHPFSEQRGKASEVMSWVLHSTGFRPPRKISQFVCFMFRASIEVCIISICREIIRQLTGLWRLFYAVYRFGRMEFDRFLSGDGFLSRWRRKNEQTSRKCYRTFILSYRKFLSLFKTKKQVLCKYKRNWWNLPAVQSSDKCKMKVKLLVVLGTLMLMESVDAQSRNDLRKWPYVTHLVFFQQEDSSATGIRESQRVKSMPISALMWYLASWDSTIKETWTSCIEVMQLH
jgi:hypothetical protein